MRLLKFVLLSLWVSLVLPSGALAQAGGFLFLQCQGTRPDGSTEQQIHRIGNGQWDYFTNGHWAPLGGAACGGRDGPAERTCTFSEAEFVSRLASSRGWTVTTRIDRYTGGYSFEAIIDGGVDSASAQEGRCWPVAEPATSSRRF